MLSLILWLAMQFFADTFIRTETSRCSRQLCYHFACWFSSSLALTKQR